MLGGVWVLSRIRLFPCHWHDSSGITVESHITGSKIDNGDKECMHWSIDDFIRYIPRAINQRFYQTHNLPHHTSHARYISSRCKNSYLISCTEELVSSDVFSTFAIRVASPSIAFVDAISMPVTRSPKPWTYARVA